MLGLCLPRYYLLLKDIEQSSYFQIIPACRKAWHHPSSITHHPSSITHDQYTGSD
jgi:hypothetical protein